MRRDPPLLCPSRLHDFQPLPRHRLGRAVAVMAEHADRLLQGRGRLVPPSQPDERAADVAEHGGAADFVVIACHQRQRPLEPFESQRPASIRARGVAQEEVRLGRLDRVVGGLGERQRPFQPAFSLVHASQGHERPRRIGQRVGLADRLADHEG